MASYLLIFVLWLVPTSVLVAFLCVLNRRRRPVVQSYFVYCEKPINARWSQSLVLRSQARDSMRPTREELSACVSSTARFSAASEN